MAYYKECMLYPNENPALYLQYSEAKAKCGSTDCNPRTGQRREEDTRESLDRELNQLLSSNFGEKPNLKSQGG